MVVVACLHTAASNRAVFEAVCPPGLVLRHTIRADLLVAAERDGKVSEALACRTAEVLQRLAIGASAVLLTCSTLGAAAGRASAAAAVPIVRADAALAEAAMQRSGNVVVLCAAPTTLAPTRALFDDGSGRLDLRLVADAWGLFRAGDLAAYHRCVAAAADAAFALGAGTVVLAQASMAAAAELCRGGVPLTVPVAALVAVEQAMR